MSQGKENIEAVKLGVSNLSRHVSNIRKFGLPVIVAINHFVADTDKEMEILKKRQQKKVEEQQKKLEEMEKQLKQK